jgi:hypothetical protein
MAFYCDSAVICGHIARSKIRKSGGALSGKGIATAGLILVHRTGAGGNGHPVTCQHDPVGIASACIVFPRKSRKSRPAMARSRSPSPVRGRNCRSSISRLRYKSVIKAKNVFDRNNRPESCRRRSNSGKHHQLTRDRMLQKMKNASATEPLPLTIDGHPALQEELSGTQNGTDVVFLHTTVDDGEHFQQILAWTLESRWQEQNQLLREITRSFHREKQTSMEAEKSE